MVKPAQVRIVSAGKPHTTHVYVEGKKLEGVVSVEWRMTDEGLAFANIGIARVAVDVTTEEKAKTKTKDAKVVEEPKE